MPAIGQGGGGGAPPSGHQLGPPPSNLPTLQQAFNNAVRRGDWRTAGQIIRQLTLGAKAPRRWSPGQPPPPSSAYVPVGGKTRNRVGGSPNTTNVPSFVPKQYVPWVRSAASGTGLPASVVAAQINDESGFDPTATSSAGAQGIAQFEPGTWKGLGVKGSPYDSNAALNGYTLYMGQLLRQYHGNIRNALAAYNAGSANIAAGYGYADTILSAAGIPSGATAGKRGSYGGTRPGGQPTDGGGGSSGQQIDDIFAAYNAELDTPRTAPPGTKNPFQWFLMSLTGNWQQENQ